MVWCGLGDQTPGLVRILRMMPCQPNSNSNSNTSICKAHNVSIRAESEAPTAMTQQQMERWHEQDGEYLLARVVDEVTQTVEADAVDCEQACCCCCCSLRPTLSIYIPTTHVHRHRHAYRQADRHLLLIDNIRSRPANDWRIRGRIITTALCCIVHRTTAELLLLVLVCT